VRHREPYEAIGDAGSRLRRPPTVPGALERIMLLDVILKEPDLAWLVTSEEKMPQEARRELRTLLERHLTFLAARPTWTLRVLILPT
jgi:hypothetical protein